MDWILANWFWILIFVLFVAMHLFGHGGHGGHGAGNGQRGKGERDGDETPPRPSGHHH